MDNLNVMDEYMEMYEDYYEELEDVYYNGNCEECIYYIECDCHLQCVDK